MGEVTPYNRIENFLAKGSGAPVAPYNRMERILAGEDLEPTNRLEYFAKEAASGGGGNPNSVQVIEGTLAEPWGDNALELAVAINNQNATAILHLDATSLGLGNYQYPVISDGSYFQISLTSIGRITVFDSEAIWVFDNETEDFILQSARIVEAAENDPPECSITDMSPYATLLPTTLTIIWHPLPT